MVDIQGAQQLFCSFPAIHKLIIWDGVWVQDAVAAQMYKRFLGLITVSLEVLYSKSDQSDLCVWFVLPLFELSIEHAVGKALSADPDAFQNTVAA